MSILQFIRDNLRWLAAGVLLTFVSSFGQTYFIAIFAGEIQLEFGLSHGDWGGIYLLGTMASGFLMIWVGVTADHFRLRSLAFVFILTLTLVCFAMSVFSAVWMLPLIIFGLRFSGQGMISHIAVVAMARWYVRARGKAIAIAGLGFSLGEACLPLIFVGLLTTGNWRSLWVVAGLTALATIPILLWLLKQERVPAVASAREDAVGMNGRHWGRGDVIRDWRFWALVPVATLSGTFGTALFFQQVHLAEVKGWSHVELVSLFPLYTVTTIFCGLLYGLAIDRWGSTRLMPLFAIPMAFGYFLFFAADSLWVGALAFLCVGIGQGGAATVAVAFWPEVFGTRHLGAIKALATALMVIGSGLGPAMTGWLIDAGVGLPDQMLGFSVYMLCICAITYLVVARIRRDL